MLDNSGLNNARYASHAAKTLHLLEMMTDGVMPLDANSVQGQQAIADNCQDLVCLACQKDVDLMERLVASGQESAAYMLAHNSGYAMARLKMMGAGVADEWLVDISQPNPFVQLKMMMVLDSPSSDIFKKLIRQIEQNPISTVYDNYTESIKVLDSLKSNFLLPQDDVKRCQSLVEKKASEYLGSSIATPQSTTDVPDIDLDITHDEFSEVVPDKKDLRSIEPE